MSVIIPTLNEAPRLPRLLGDLQALTSPHEIIIADGGSSDGTVELAAELGARVVRAAAGRGHQLRAGIEAARGDWLLVIHADARVSPEALAEAQGALRRPDLDYACWRFAIDARGLWARCIECGAALRWHLLGLAYGDQGLLVRRDVYQAAGGYPDVVIMEDVALIRRLRRLARGERFRHSIRSDPRRWMREGPVRTTLRNLLLLGLFLLGARPDRLARWYQPEIDRR